MGRPKCKICKEKISIFDRYEEYFDGWVHESCRDKELNKLIFAKRGN